MVYYSAKVPVIMALIDAGQISLVQDQRRERFVAGASADPTTLTGRPDRTASARFMDDPDRLRRLPTGLQGEQVSRVPR